MSNSMRLFLLIILISEINPLFHSSAVASTLRQTNNFNREWKFLLGDHPGAEASSFADAKWDIVGLPHSFSTPYFASTRFYIGYGWYRNHFHALPAWAGKRVFLEFEGAFQDAQVFVNGRAVGRHR